MNEIKEKMVELVENGLVHGHFEGPKDNVLVCDTLNDWCIASGELVKAGYGAMSPGGYGDSHPTSRQNVHNKIWRSGTVSAVQYKRKVFFFCGLLSQDEEYMDIVFLMKGKKRGN
jgi:hypothetical protein